MYKIVFSRKAVKDVICLSKSPFYEKFIKLLRIIQKDPFQKPPLFKPLIGCDCFARRLNIQHRLVYRVNTLSNTIEICSCWGHYEDK